MTPALPGPVAPPSGQGQSAQGQSGQGHDAAPVRLPKPRTRGIPLRGAGLAVATVRAAGRLLTPASLARSPVRLVVAVAAVVTTGAVARRLWLGLEPAVFAGQVAAWLWLTLAAVTIGEAAVEARGRGRAAALRGLPGGAKAKLLVLPREPGMRWLYEMSPAGSLSVGELVLVEAGDVVPADGEVVEGIAAVDESMVTGESAPVIRESGGDRSAVTGGTQVVSDWLVVRITAMPGDSVHGRVIALIDAIRRQAAARQIRLTLPQLGLALAAVAALAVLGPGNDGPGGSVAFLVAMLVALMPTATVGLLAVVAVAGADRLVRANVVAKSPRAIEAAGRIDTLLLDKTGTITLGCRTAGGFIPLPGVGERELAEAALLASLGDDTPEGRSIGHLAERLHGVTADPALVAETIPFTAETRMSGVRLRDGTDLRKGAEPELLRHAGLAEPAELKAIVERVARAGGTPLVVARNGRVLGVVHLKDTLKPGLRPRFAQLARMGVRTVMVTGDNPLTAATIAAEAGVDHVVAGATPAGKAALIRDLQSQGHKVAMCGDGTNDAPALAQADLGIAMNSGTADAREAGDMIDLDSDPFKLMEVIRVGRQRLRVGRSAVAFALAADTAKALAVMPAVFAASHPWLAGIDPLHLSGPEGAVLSALATGVLVILAPTPWVMGALRRNVGATAAHPLQDALIFGFIGLALSVTGVVIIDAALAAAGLIQELLTC